MPDIFVAGFPAVPDTGTLRYGDGRSQPEEIERAWIVCGRSSASSDCSATPVVAHMHACSVPSAAC
jgi:hypothetical protein